MTDEPLRAQLAALLDWKDAHVAFDDAVEGIPQDALGVRSKTLPYSIWELVEHMRICQRDILDFCRDPNYVERPAEDYYPREVAPRDAAAWRESLRRFREDLEALRALAADPGIDLFAAIPRGTGQTYLRELVLVADHNAYTLGQIVVIRRLLGVWKTG